MFLNPYRYEVVGGGTVDEDSPDFPSPAYLDLVFSTNDYTTPTGELELVFGSVDYVPPRSY